YNGTGVGYNQLAPTGMARLTALQLLQDPSSGDFIGSEIALPPNSAYLDYSTIGALPGNLGPVDPFLMPQPSATFLALNNPSAAVPVIGYAAFDGPGGSDESYDAADFQNMFLALQ